MMEKKDWKIWHSLYDNTDSNQSQRLVLVRNAILNNLPENSSSAFQVIDICAGDGRDLLPVLASYAHNDIVHSYLVELDPKLASLAVESVNKYGLKDVTVVVGDASLPSMYQAVIPADLILLCGVFGNVSSEDIGRIIETLPQFSKTKTTIIWTQNLRDPALVSKTRELFQINNFMEANFEITKNGSYGVGVSSYVGKSKVLNTDNKLFTFIK